MGKAASPCPGKALVTHSSGPGHSGLGSRKMNLDIGFLLLHPLCVGHSKWLPLNLKL